MSIYYGYDKVAGAGGASGSNVKISADYTSGNKIATISVDNIPTNIYSPAVNVPTKTSQLTNDSGFLTQSTLVNVGNTSLETVSQLGSLKVWIGPLSSYEELSSASQLQSDVFYFATQN